MVNTGQGQVEMPYEPNKNCDGMLKSWTDSLSFYSLLAQLLNQFRNFEKY